MKNKKLVSIITAALLVISQGVVFPLAASANTWVDDSTYAGGGYWMDDEGYIVSDSGESAPAPSVDLVTGEDEPDYSSYNMIGESVQSSTSEESSQEQTSEENSGAATWGTITAIVSNDPTAVQFHVNTDGDVYFEFYSGGIQVTPEDYTYSNGTLSVKGSTTMYQVLLYSSNGTFFNDASAIREHDYSITYNLEGKKVTVFTGTLSMGDSPTYTAPVMFTQGNAEYELVGGENSATQIFSYGKSDYEFEYKVYNPVDLTASVESVDERGNRLDYVEQTVVYRGGDVIFDLPAVIEKDGRTYIKADNTNRVTVNYTSAELNYTVNYKEAQPVSTEPYSVKVNYVDAETGVAIGGDFFNVTTQNIVDGATVTFGIPMELAVYTGDSTVYYQAEHGAAVRHPATDSKIREYTVNYTKAAVDAPYTWSVRLVDVATGKTLDSKNYELNVASSATHDTESQITVNGIKYLLDASMQSQYVHNYGDSGRIQYVYYNAEGTEAAAPYSINVRYVEIGGNTELSAQSYNVNAGENAAVPTDETFSGTDGTQYVRLQGQGDIDHNYYSAQRTYSVYYRDVNDVQNADTVIVREEVIDLGGTNTETEPQPEAPETAEPEEPETAEPEAGATAAPEATTAPETVNNENAPLAAPVQGQGEQNTVIRNENNGQSEIVDDESVPMADRAKEEIEDSGAPLASAPKADADAASDEAQGGSVNWILIVSIAAVFMVLAAAVTVLVYNRKKKNHEN